MSNDFSTQSVHRSEAFGRKLEKREYRISVILILKQLNNDILIPDNTKLEESSEKPSQKPLW